MNGQPEGATGEMVAGPAAGRVAVAEPGLPGRAGEIPAVIMTRPSVSVVVCAFTEARWRDLSAAIASLRAQTEAPREIILVIDHCPRLLRRASRQFRGLVIVPNQFARGLSGSRNTGVAHASGDVVAFLDDDAAADPAWIATLAGRYAGPGVLGVGGQVRPAWRGGRPGWFPPELDWVVGCSYQGMPTRTAPVRNFIGANMSFRRDVLDGLGGFSGALGRIGSVPLGCEETELCLRATRRYPGGVLVYEPAARVSHTVPQPRARWGYLRSRCYAEGLSKARVAQLAGTQRGLASERSYLRSAVPAAVGRSLASAAAGRPAGLGAALALTLAVVVTGTGYLVGRVSASCGRHTSALSRLAGVARRAAAAPAAPWAGLVAAVALWAGGLAVVRVEHVATASFGLVSVLPVMFWAALGVLIVSFALILAQRRNRWPVLAAHLVALVVMLHATPAIVYGTLRYSWAWKHVGVTDYIVHHGINFGLGGILGAYQGWPGFFSLNAFLVSGSGLASALSYASWALPLLDLLWLGPVILIARSFTADWRLVWTAAWLFELANWSGQDYFSPQGVAFFLYLAVIAVCLRWLWTPRTHPARAPVPRATRYAMVACLLPLVAAIASSHQLTPFMLLTALTLLAVFRYLRPWWLPVAVAAITAGWLAYGALPWLSANSYQIFAGLGAPWANVSAHVVGGGSVPAGQVLVQWAARLLSAAMGIMALIGFWRYRRARDADSRRSWNRLALLVAAALPAVAANSYGGEIIFRVYLFALPFLAVAAAAAFFPHGPAGPAAECPTEPATAGPEDVSPAAAGAAGAATSPRPTGSRRPASFTTPTPFITPVRLTTPVRTALAGLRRSTRAALAVLGRPIRPALAWFRRPAAAARPRRRRPARAALAVAAASVLLAAGFALSNYGMEAMNYFTPQEVAASQWLYRNAPAGAQIVAANSNFPWAFTHYNRYRYTFLDTPASLGAAVRRAPASEMVAIMGPNEWPASYLVLTTSQAAEISLQGAWPAGSYNRVLHDWLASGRFRVVYKNPDVMILQLDW